MQVVECVPEAEHGSREQHWIAHFRNLGYRLLNIQAGGGGQAGYTIPDATKAKIAASLKGHEVPDEVRQKLREALTGRTASNAAREAVGVASKASWDRLTPAAAEARRAKMMAGRKPWTAEMKAALSAKKSLAAQRRAQLGGKVAGVRFSKDLGKWIATGPGPLRKHLGVWGSQEEAVAAKKAFEASRKS